MGEFDYKVKAGVNSVDESNDLGTRLDAMVNIPLNDVMALRLTGFRNEKAGYIDKLNYGEDDVNSELAVGGRASLRWNVTDSIAITPTYYNVTTESEGAMVAFEPYVENFNARFPGLPRTKWRSSAWMWNGNSAGAPWRSWAPIWTATCTP